MGLERALPTCTEVEDSVRFSKVRGHMCLRFLRLVIFLSRRPNVRRMLCLVEMRVAGSSLLNVAVILILIFCQQRLPCKVENFLAQLGAEMTKTFLLLIIDTSLMRLRRSSTLA